ncbi:hypothetical protein KR018_007903, partial [Drosophila ironensis]
GRIVNGEDVTIEEHPYQVSIQTTKGFHFCGGSLITSDTVLTAAHCMQSYTASEMQVRLGSTSKSDGGEVVTVKSFKYHEGYNSKLMVNDVAVIKLSTPVRLSAKIRTIELADETPASGTDAIVTGWGTTCFLLCSSPDTLMGVTVGLLQKEECASDNYSYGDSIQDTMVCAYSEKKDACQGDSGGPLVANSKQVGVVSWGSGCAWTGYPGVYADVASMKSWILKTAEELDGGEVVSVKSFKYHEGYNSNLMVNDVAVIKLSTPVLLSAKIRTIELADETPASGTDAIVTGWGTTCFLFCTSPDTLMGVNVGLLQKEDCASNTYSYGDSIQDTMVCAYSEKKDACQGDSGGPLVAHYKQVGVVSWGNGCAKTGYPGVYADVASLKSWILKTAEE